MKLSLGGSKSNVKAKLPDRKEWDFRARPGKSAWEKVHPFDFLPEDEVWHCWQYEYDRFGPDGTFVLERRANAKDSTSFESLLEQHYESDPNGKNGRPPIGQWAHFLWPEWPDQPYLSIPRAERKGRFKRCWGHLPKKSLRLFRLVDIYKNVESWKAAGKHPDNLPRWRGIPILLNKDDEDTWVARRFPARDIDPIIEIAALEIDFSLPNALLIKLFEQWLTEWRKKKGYKHRENRGPASQTHRMRSELIDWGAWRLINAGMTYKEATEYTQDCSGKPLFEDEATWSRALTRASDRLGKPNRMRQQRDRLDSEKIIFGDIPRVKQRRQS